MVATALAKQVGNKCVRLLDVESDACVVTQNWCSYSKLNKYCENWLVVNTLSLSGTMVLGLTCSLTGLSHLLAGVTSFECREMGVFG